MLLFFSSLVLVMLFAFCIANIFDSKNTVNNIIYFLLSVFANIVFSFEILSLFSVISEVNFIIINSILAIIALVFWIVKKCPVIEIDFNSGLKKLLNVFKLDKTLLALTLGLLFAAVVSLILISFLPAIDIDSTTYHVVRSLFWIDNGSLNHFPTAEARMIMFPINSELLYSWLFLFLKKDLWLGIFNFCGVILYIVSLFGIMSELTESLRKKLWVILISLSFPFVLVRFTAVETSLIIAALVMTSIYLYMQFMKNKKFSTCLMSSLSMALVVGTKTSVLLMMPALVLWFLWYSWFSYREDFYKPFIKYCVCFVVMFLLFASYNYILNFFNYGNFISAGNIATSHANTDGILSIPSNLYRYIFDFFAMPEYQWSSILSSNILKLRDFVLTSLDANIGLGYTSALYKHVPYTVSSADSAFGFFGILMMLPLLIYSVYNGFVSKNKKTLIITSFVWIFLLSVFIMAYKLAFMSFNVRFFTTFAMITVPIISFTYKKGYNFYKILLAFIAIVYYFTIPTNVSLYPLGGMLDWARAGADMEKLREVCECSFFTKEINVKNYRVRDISCFLSKKIKSYNNQNKILFFAPMEESLMPVKKLMFDGYKIDVNLATEAEKINFDDYNIIITINNEQEADTILSVKSLDENGYTYSKGILCSYLDNKGVIIKVTPDYIPAKSVCYFNNNFSKNYNLKLMKQYGFMVGDKAKNYQFYENLNRPVIR